MALLLWHPQRELFLVCYVDDLKLSGPDGQMEQAWKEISQHIDIEPLTNLDHFLGCSHSYVDPSPGVDANIIKYEMRSFWESCVALYQTLAPAAKLTKVQTQYLIADGGEVNNFRAPIETNKSIGLAPPNVPDLSHPTTS